MSNYLRRTDTFQTIKARQYILPNPLSTQNYSMTVNGSTLAIGPLGSSVGLSMTASGQVGIGTTTPATTLDVSGDVRCQTLHYTALDPPIRGGLQNPLLATLNAGGCGILNVNGLGVTGTATFGGGINATGDIDLQSGAGVASLQILDGGITSAPTIGSVTAYNQNRFAILSAGATSFNASGGNYVAGNGIRLQGADIEWGGGSIVSKGSMIEIDGGRSALAAVNHGQIRMYSGGDLALTLTETGGAIIEGDLEVKGAVTFDVSLNAVPAGIVTMFVFASPPPGWLNCDGTAYSTADYPRLFAVIGYAYGGSGATFNVPDMRGRFPLGTNGTYGLNAQGGSMTTSLAPTNLPGHKHNINVTTSAEVTNVGVTMRVNTVGYDSSWGGGQEATGAPNQGRNNGDQMWNMAPNPASDHGLIVSDLGHTHSIDATTDTGIDAVGLPVQTAPPYIGLNFIIKT